MPTGFQISTYFLEAMVAVILQDFETSGVAGIAPNDLFDNLTVLCDIRCLFQGCGVIVIMLSNYPESSELLKFYNVGKKRKAV